MTETPDMNPLLRTAAGRAPAPVENSMQAALAELQRARESNDDLRIEQAEKSLDEAVIQARADARGPAPDFDAGVRGTPSRAPTDMSSLIRGHASARNVFAAEQAELDRRTN